MTLTTVNPALLDTQAQYTGFKNRIINGAMVIDQRNAGAAVTLSGSGPYIVDRFKVQSPAGTVQQITSTLNGFTKSLKYTATGSNAYVQAGQQIEFTNCSDLQNQTVSISFRAKANNSNAGSTALVVRTRTVAGIDGAAIFTGANADTSITLTTLDVAYTVTRTLPATFGALSLEFVLGSHVSGDGFEVTGVQLEKGSTATSFDYRPYGTELGLCQRYYWQLNSTGNPALFAIAGSTNSNASLLFYPTLSGVPMRASPSVSTSAANTFGTWPSGSGGSDILGSSFYSVGASGSPSISQLPPSIEFMIDLASSPGTAISRFGFRSASGFIKVSAEL